MSVKVIKIDDMEETEVVADETVLLGLDGKTIELDLSTKNAAKLRNWLAPWLAAGRSAGGQVTRQKATVSKSTSPNREQNEAIREWARGKGIQVSHKGRISQSVVDQFNEEHSHPVTPVPQPEFSGV